MNLQKAILIGEILTNISDNLSYLGWLNCEWYELSVSYSKSLNIFYVMISLRDNNVCFCPLALLMGRNGDYRDNFHYEGLLCLNQTLWTARSEYRRGSNANC